MYMYLSTVNIMCIHIVSTVMCIHNYCIQSYVYMYILYPQLHVHVCAFILHNQGGRDYSPSGYIYTMYAS